MKIRPLYDRIVVKRLEAQDEKTPGGLIVPDSAKQKPQEYYQAVFNVADCLMRQTAVTGDKSKAADKPVDDQPGDPRRRGRAQPRSQLPGAQELSKMDAAQVIYLLRDFLMTLGPQQNAAAPGTPGVKKAEAPGIKHAAR